MALINVPEEQILEKIAFENPWWSTGRIDPYFDEMKHRHYFFRFYSYAHDLELRRAVVLMGPRRVGKTVMIHQTIQALINNGVHPRKICYLSVDTPLFNGVALERLFEFCRKSLSVGNQFAGFYVFFDEVQYLKDWEVHLKTLVDTYRGVKFIVTGSAAAALKLKSQESGAGRFTDFTLPPLTFHEYILLTGQDHLITETAGTWEGKAFPDFDTPNIAELNSEFIRYINFGGYPEVSLSARIQADAGQLIKNDIIDKVLLRDLPSLYGIADIQELNSLFTTIAFNTANEYSLEALSNTSGVSKNTIKRYLVYLESAFLIKIVDRVSQNGKKFKRADYFKIYLTNPSLRSALFSPVTTTSEAIGNLVETAIYSQWFHRYWMTLYYWRDKRGTGEVDLVGLSKTTLKPTWAVEVKWSNKYFDRPEQLKSLYKFVVANRLKSAVITTIDKKEVIDYNGINYRFVPAALYAYGIGRRSFVEE